MANPLKNPVAKIFEDLRKNGGSKKVSSKDHAESVDRMNKSMEEFRFKKARQEEKILEEIKKTILL